MTQPNSPAATLIEEAINNLREFTPIRRAQKICCGGRGRTRLWRQRREQRMKEGILQNT